MRKTPVDVWILSPIKKFISGQTTSGIVLFTAAVVALILSNSPISEQYLQIWEYKLTIGYENFMISKTLHHWINDGLMAVFFFVIGLELKREILAGELSKPKDALLPIVAGAGGMIVPALFYLVFNKEYEAAAGWGIPMATDIAFALGILYMLGNKVPISLRVFLTALAIADDLGAVLVIAFFYTSEISFFSLGIGAIFLTVLVTANYMGVRSTNFYGVIGVGGLWLAFLLSGVHATIAAVLAAFTIPAYVKIDDRMFAKKVRFLSAEFEKCRTDNTQLVTVSQLHVLEKFRHLTKDALTPLQRLEHSLHPFVAFVVLPVFALANAGVSFGGNFLQHLSSPVTQGIIFGLVVGKFIGIVGSTRLMVALNLASLPKNVNWNHISGIGLLAGVGFTMSLFITELAFTSNVLVQQAKIGILVASFIAGLLGYFFLKKGIQKEQKRKKKLQAIETTTKDALQS